MDQKMRSDRAVVADIGGTNARFALSFVALPGSKALWS